MVSLKNLAIVFIFSCSVQASTSSGPPSSTFIKVKNDLLSSETEASNILRGIRDAHCSILLEEQGKILSILLEQEEVDNFIELFWSCYKSSPEMMDVFLTTSLKSSMFPALEFVYNQMIQTKSSVKYRQLLLGECAKEKNYMCFKLFGNGICNVTTSNGNNLLHLAAGLDNSTLFRFADRCKLLMNQRNFDGLYPMEYVESANLAALFDRKWREVSKEKHLSLQASAKHYDLCSKFGILDSEGSIQPGSTLKAAFTNGMIEDEKNLYCPNIMTKINLLEMKKDGEDVNLHLMEWLSTLLTDIFVREGLPGASVSDFTAPLFEYFTSLEGYVPTGQYDEKVYEFAGKVISITNYFGFGYNYPVKFDQNLLQFGSKLQRSFSAFQKGLRALNFSMRFEIHSDEHQRDHFLLKIGKEDTVKVIISNQISLDSIARDGIRLMRAFESLTDEQKMKLLHILRGGNPKRKHVYFSIKGRLAEEERFEVVRQSSEVSVCSVQSAQEYKRQLEAITERK